MRTSGHLRERELAVNVDLLGGLFASRDQHGSHFRHPIGVRSEVLRFFT